MIVNQTSSNPELAKRCLNCVNTNCLTQVKRKSIENKGYISCYLGENTTLVENGCPQTEEGIHKEAMGLKLYWG